MADDNGIDYFYTTLDTVSGLSNTNDLPTDPNLIMAPDISGIVSLSTVVLNSRD